MEAIQLEPSMATSEPGTKPAGTPCEVCADHVELLETQVAALRRENAQLSQANKELTESLARVSNERNQYARRIANAEVMSPTPAPAKSVKLPDAPILTDGKDPQSEDWILLIWNKALWEY
jgi:hypothetical protein